MDVLTSYFLAVTAHFCILFCVMWNRADYVEASMPPPPVDVKQFADLDGSLLLCLIIGITFIVTEIAFLFRQVLSNKLAIICLVSHVLSCIVLLKFVIDVHMVSHFWLVLLLFSVPPILIQLYLFGSSFNKRSCF